MSFELLKRRALSFLRDARFDLEHGDYDLTLFHVDQFIQLYSKYLIYKKIGDYPKTHGIVRLLRELSRIYDNCGLKDIINNYLETLYLIEESYISSRYLPREYDRELALKILEFANKIYEVFECLEKH
ncbi:MAG: HEPN domain-containing protein [Thermoprotei archaeon]